MDERSRFHELDALRGLLALWVFATHYLEAVEVQPEGLVSKVALAGIIPVTVFMVLSGFVIARSLMAERDSYGAFLLKRLARLYPAYLIALVLGTLAIPLALAAIPDIADPRLRAVAVAIWTTSDEHYWAHLLAHLAFVHGMIPDAVLPGAVSAINGPMWSLSLEMQFYLLAPWLVAVLSAPLRRPLLFGLVVLVPLLWLLADLPDAILPAFLPMFVLGILTALHAERLRRDPAVLLQAAVAVIAASLLTRNPVVAAPAMIWAVAMVIACWEDSRPARAASAILGSRPFQVMGAISYGFYLYHFPILVLWRAALRALGIDFGDAAFAPALLLALPLSIAVAALSFYFVERPLYTRAKQRLAARREQAVMSDAA